MGNAARRGGWLPRALILAGAVLIAGSLAVEAYRYPWAARFEGSQSEQAVADPDPIVLQDRDKGSVVVEEPGAGAAPEATAAGVLPSSETEESEPVPVFVQLGILKIPRLGVSRYVLEGTGRQLSYGTGHVEGTAGLGQAGNCAVAGHRSGAFRYLDKLEPGDSVILKAGGNVYTYSVTGSTTVLPEEVWVLEAVEDTPCALTLITCTPYAVSSHRLIVRASLTDVNGETPEDFYGGASQAAGEEAARPDG